MGHLEMDKNNTEYLFMTFYSSKTDKQIIMIFMAIPFHLTIRFVNTSSVAIVLD